MRNPIRLKNLRLRFLPLFALGAAMLLLREPTRASWLAGAPFVAVGAALRGWAAGHLVKTDRLTTTGPYAHLRHPLYLGTLLVGTGFALIAGGITALLALAVLWPWFALRYFPRKDRAEAERLRARHGEAFARYLAAVPALAPRLRAWRGDGDGACAGAQDARARWRLARYSENNELGTLLAIGAGLLLFAWRTRAVAA